MDSGIAVKYFRPFLKNMLDLYYSEPPGVDEDEESSFFSTAISTYLLDLPSFRAQMNGFAIIVLL